MISAWRFWLRERAGSMAFLDQANGGHQLSGIVTDCRRNLVKDFPDCFDGGIVFHGCVARRNATSLPCRLWANALRLPFNYNNPRANPPTILSGERIMKRLILPALVLVLAGATHGWAQDKKGKIAPTAANVAYGEH
jgi:hypothetical protein